jgi:tRNA G46 methylase TrmB
LGNDARTCLEVCAGGGEWASGQAAADPTTNWVASEIRGDRVHQIFDRMRSARLPNLACLGGDAALALAHHTAPGAFDAIWVTFPEPPADHGDADAYLLNAAFFRDAYAALAPGGRGLFVVTDNLALLDGVADTLYSLWDGATLAYAPASGAEAGLPRVQAWVQTRGGRALISEGMPEAFGGGGASYFDRLWASRSKQRRFHVAVTKPAA